MTWTVIDPDATVDGQWHIARDGAVIDRMRGDSDAWEVLTYVDQLAGAELAWRLTADGGFESVATPPEAPVPVAVAVTDILDRHAQQPLEVIARRVIARVLEMSLPGLYVTHHVEREGVDSTLWIHDPERPHLPPAVLYRTEAGAALFDMIAALVPDRTDNEGGE